jgi:deoxyribose-phosphate aldolase
MPAPTSSSAPILTPPAWSTRWTPLTHEPTADEMARLFDMLTYADIADTIDHSLLRPELDDAFLDDNLRLAADYQVASVTMRPTDVERAVAALKDARVMVGTVVGFPHGNHLTTTKVFETERALDQGAREIDMVIPIGALKSGRDLDVEADIRAVVDVSHAAHAAVKVIFENAYLTDDEKTRVCHLCENAGADFVKTSTGFAQTGATPEDLMLMRANTTPPTQVKAAGGVRTLDALLAVMCLGVTRIGATATKTILDDFKARKAAAGNGDTASISSGALEQGTY